MIAIDVKDLKKIYKLYNSPTQRLKEILLRKPLHEEFVALDDINFSILQGDTVGIIGENGAGKSTLLKILAKTLKPTTGTVQTNGKTSALLELGAGFNPELTGEENIYLNAYLMGLTKNEIESKKQAIINFSELGEFIRRPVKNYSSGMHVRLAFSIATAINPDILIIDEALSVGDGHFQKKCIDRMLFFKESGKTILFCSHVLYHVQELCQKTIWLHKGRIKSIGETEKVITDYQNHERDKTLVHKEEKPFDIIGDSKNSGDKPVRIYDVKIIDKNGIETEIVKTLEPAVFSFKIRCNKSNTMGHIGFAIMRNDEIITFATCTKFDKYEPINFRDGQEFKIRIISLPLLTGKYSLITAVLDETTIHPYDILRQKTFTVLHSGKELGMTYIDHEWII